MTTLTNAIYKAKKLAQKTQDTAYVIFDPTHLDEPPDRSYYAATAEEAETYFQDCEIVDAVEPEDIVANTEPGSARQGDRYASPSLSDPL